MTTNLSDWYPSANVYKEGELLEITYGTRNWVTFWEHYLGVKNAVIGYKPENIDLDSGILYAAKKKAIMVGSIVMYLGPSPAEQTGVKESLVRVLYQEEIVAMMWECLIRAGKNENS